MYFCTSVHFKTSDKKTDLLIHTRSLKKYFQIYKQVIGKFALNFRLTQGQANPALNNWPHVDLYQGGMVGLEEVG